MLKKINICRPITFYNNFMPSAEMDQKWEYCALGAIDGIDVGDNILIGENSTILESIWESQKKFCMSLKGHYASQQIYAMRYDDPDREKNFWCGNEKYPFFFFCRMQCDENKIEIWKNRERLEKAIQIRDKVKAMVYLTYDNTDLLLVLRTANYNIGAELINALHQKANLSMNADKQCIVGNSYTIFAVRYVWIKDYVLNNLAELNQAKIDTVQIRVIENRSGVINNIKEEVENRLHDRKASTQVECVPVLGADDDVIILSQIGWGDFLSLYCKDTGVFTTKGGGCFCEDVAGITTQIEQKLQSVLCELEQNGIAVLKPQSKDQNLWKKAYRDRIEEIYKILDEEKTGDDLKEVYIILNTLSKFDGELFNDYAFFPILDSLKTLLELLEKNEKDKEQLYDFLNRFSIYAQSSAISDRHTTQMLSFNSKIYDIPVKIMAYYNAYLYNVKSILNTEKNKYSFFVVPARNDYVKVNERYPRVSVNKRLMIVEIPEYSAYRLDDMMIILAHESAHYVGDLYRDRTTRYRKVVQSYAHIYVQYIRDNINHIMEEKIKDLVWEELEERTSNALFQRIQYEYDEDYILNRSGLDCPMETKKKIANRYKEYAMYFLELEKFIRDSMADILSSGLSNLFNPILYKLNKTERKEVESILQGLSDIFMMEHPEGSTRLNSSALLSELESLYRECFADLMVILILGMDAKEYISSLISNADLQGMKIEDFCRSEALFRLMAIIITVVSGGTTQALEWKKELGSDSTEDWARVGKSALEQWDRFPEEKAGKPDGYSENVLYAFQDRQVMGNLIFYLLGCQDLFLNSVNQNREELQAIRDIFKTCHEQLSSSVEGQLSKMEKFIQDYKMKLL